MPRILVAATEPEVAADIRERLHSLGYELAPNVTGVPTQQQILAAQPDLLLLDSDLPIDLSGLDIPVVYLARDAVAAGPDAIHPPFGTPDLRMAIELARYRYTTDRRIRELEQADARWQREKVDSLAALSSGVAHDFNNLLAVIMGNASMALLDLPEHAPARTMIEQIEQATQRAAELVRQLLTYAGKGRFVTQPLDLNELIAELEPQIRALVGERITLRILPSTNLPTILADAGQLRQVVLNLGLNAAEAIGDNPGMVTISTALRTLEGDALSEYRLGADLITGEYIELVVSDTGHGVDSETLSKMFDPFFSTKFAGRGLGLATVLGIIQGHNGAIRVASTPDQGTSLSLVLPPSPIPSYDRQAQPLPQPRLSQPISGAVLVVDDDEAVRTTAARLLERFGYTVLTANDGAAGVDVFRANLGKISCVLLDLTMPHMNGVEALQAIRKIAPDSRVVLMSGYHEQDITTRFAGLDVTGFLPKPFTPTQLHDKLRQAMLV